MKSLKFIGYLMFVVLFSSCASLNQSLSFEEDDIYYSNDFQHRLNEQALLMNMEVGMPDSAITYFDETYADAIRPSYQKRINSFNDVENTESYIEDYSESEEYYNQASSSQNNRWMSTVSLGFVAGGYGYYSNPYYGYNSTPYYSSYNSSPSYFYNTNNNYYNQRAPRVNSSTTNTPYEPFSNYGSNRSNRGAPVNTTINRSTYTNPNPGYQQTKPGVSSNRAYKTRTPSSSGTNSGGYNSGSRSGGNYSGGSVGGYRRR